MKKKILACLLILFPIFSLGMAKADTVKIVSDTAYAPFEFKDSDQTYKGIAREISDSGQLLVQLDKGQSIWLNSGEISLTNW